MKKVFENVRARVFRENTKNDTYLLGSMSSEELSEWLKFVLNKREDVTKIKLKLREEDES